MGSGITLRNNEIKDVVKVIRTLENRGILLKGTTRIVCSQEGGLFNFLGSLIRTDLPLMKSVLTPLAKSVLVLLGLESALATDASILKKKFYLGTTTLIFSNKNWMIS